jgi:hypothetical protein
VARLDRVTYRDGRTQLILTDKYIPYGDNFVFTLDREESIIAKAGAESIASRTSRHRTARWSRKIQGRRNRHLASVDKSTNDRCLYQCRYGRSVMHSDDRADLAEIDEADHPARLGPQRSSECATRRDGLRLSEAAQREGRRYDIAHDPLWPSHHGIARYLHRGVLHMQRSPPPGQRSLLVHRRGHIRVRAWALGAIISGDLNRSTIQVKTPPVKAPRCPARPPFRPNPMKELEEICAYWEDEPNGRTLLPLKDAGPFLSPFGLHVCYQHRRRTLRTTQR